MTEATPESHDYTPGMFNPHPITDDTLTSATDILKRSENVDSDTVETGFIHHYGEKFECVRWVQHSYTNAAESAIDDITVLYCPDYAVIHGGDGVFYLRKPRRTNTD